MLPDVLKQCPLFAGLETEELKKIRAIAIPKQVKKKEILFSDGEEAKGFYVVLSGKVKIYQSFTRRQRSRSFISSPPRCLC